LIKDKEAYPEDKAIQKFIVLRAFPVTICVHACPSQVTTPPRVSTTCTTMVGLLNFSRSKKKAKHCTAEKRQRKSMTD
jgi:hypothetical protein